MLSVVYALYLPTRTQPAHSHRQGTPSRRESDSAAGWRTEPWSVSTGHYSPPPSATPRTRENAAQSQPSRTRGGCESLHRPARGKPNQAQTRPRCSRSQPPGSVGVRPRRETPSPHEAPAVEHLGGEWHHAVCPREDQASLSSACPLDCCSSREHEQLLNLSVRSTSREPFYTSSRLPRDVPWQSSPSPACFHGP